MVTVNVKLQHTLNKSIANRNKKIAYHLAEIKRIELLISKG